MIRRRLHPLESGAKAAAVQTLCDCGAPSNLAERLDCGDFSTAFRPHRDFLFHKSLRPPESGAKAAAVQTLRDHCASSTLVRFHRRFARLQKSSSTFTVSILKP